MECPPFKIKTVEPINLISRPEREKKIKEKGLNLFLLSSKDVYIDMLTDSGTSAMSNNQWAGIMLGDESYAGSVSFDHLAKAIQEIMGFKYILPVHQGRGGEQVLDNVLIKDGQSVPGNMHFDTTRAHIEHVKGRAIDCVIDEAFDTESNNLFKGNIDTDKLESLIMEDPGKIAYVLITVTCNNGGGQPVSMENIRQVHKISKKHGLLLFLDAARYAENTYFIKNREQGYADKSIRDIVQEMMSYMDGCIMSAKKDALVNIGGFIALRDKELYNKLAPTNVLMEGFPTYGGLSGRDIEAMAIGLHEGIDEKYLSYRINQVHYLGQRLDAICIPLMKPFGGHAIFINGLKMLPHIPQENFPSMALCIECYMEGGVRGTEIGTLLAGRDPDTGKNVCPKLDLMRLAIPRRVYMQEHMDYVVNVIESVSKRSKEIQGLEFEYESPIMRHFLSRFRRIAG
ncbi:MAG: tryptophanase [Candidatus Anammoxibacter sp.]